MQADEEERDDARRSHPAVRVLRALAGTSAAAAVTITVLGLGVFWVATFGAGGAGHLAADWFYLPVLFAAARFGVAGAAAAAVAAGVLAGPLTPLDVEQGTAQRVGDWGSQAAFFLIIGVLTSLFIARFRLSLERELRLAQKERELARQKAAVISTVSHEFRTPLTIIGGAAGTLERLGLVTEEGRPLLEGLGRATRRLEGLVMSLLSAAGAIQERRAVEQEPISLREACEATATSLADLGGPDRVTFEAAPGAGILAGVPEIVSLLLHSVIENALKFSPPGSPVEVRADRDGEHARVRVRDRGPGIDETFAERAFQPFTQGDESMTREHGGLGIGLFVARNLAASLGGDLTLRRHPQGGTEAVISLPQRRSEDATAPVGSPPD